MSMVTTVDGHHRDYVGHVRRSECLVVCLMCRQSSCLQTGCVGFEATLGERMKLQLCRMAFLGIRHIHTSLSMNAAGMLVLSEIPEKWGGDHKSISPAASCLNRAMTRDLAIDTALAVIPSSAATASADASSSSRTARPPVL